MSTARWILASTLLWAALSSIPSAPRAFASPSVPQENTPPARKADQDSEKEEDKDKKHIRLSITAPDNNAVLQTARVDVSVSWSSRHDSEDDDDDRVTSISLRVNGTGVATFDVPRKTNLGTHTFGAVDLSAFANTGNPVFLVARAFLGKKKKKSVDSEAVRVTVVLQVDQTPPQIGITAPPGGPTLNTPRPSLAALVTDAGGSGVNLSSIVMKLDGIPVARTVSAVNPNTVTVSFTPAADLASGGHAVSVDATDLAGNAGATATSTFTLDLIAPASVITAPPNGATLNTPKPALSAQVVDAGGSGVDPASIVMKVDGAPVARTVTLVDANTADVSFVPAANLSPGAHAVTLDAKDLAGNVAATATNTFSLNLTAPVIAITAPPINGVGKNAQPPLSATITSAGAGVDLATIVARLDGSPVAATVSGGNPNPISLSFTPPPLPEGAHAYSVDARDLDGNAAATASRTFTIDLTPPALSAPSPANGSMTTNPAAPISLSWTDPLSGIVPGSAHVLIDGVEMTGSALITPTGFTLTPPPLTAGFHTVSASIADLAGNVGNIGWSFQLVDPVQPLLTLTPANGDQLTTARPALKATYSDVGLGLDLTTFRATIDGQDVTPAFSVGPSQATALTPDPLSDGPHVFRAEIRDNGGNLTSASSLFRVLSAAGSIGTAGGTLEVTDPSNAAFGAKLVVPPGALPQNVVFAIEVTASLPPFPAGYTSVGPLIDFTPDVTFGQPATITIPYSAPSVIALQVPVEEVLLLTFDVTQGLWILVPVTSNDTVNGRVTAQVTGLAGQVFGAAVTTPVPPADTIPPVITNLLPADGSVVNTSQPTLSASVSDAGGSGLEPASIILRLDGTVIPSAPVLADPNTATVSVSPATGLVDGLHTVSAGAGDRAGNAAATVTATFTVDTVKPVVTVGMTPPDVFTGTKTITVTFSDALSGIVDASRSILIDLSERIGEGSFAGNTWTYTAPFGVGLHSVVAEVRDRAGNLGQATISFEVRSVAQDHRPPTISVVYPDQSTNRIQGATIPIIVKASDDADASDSGVASVDLLINDSLVATKFAPDSGTSYVFNYTVTAPVGSTLFVKGQATDRAGNTSQAFGATIGVISAPAGSTARGFKFQFLNGTSPGSGVAAAVVKAGVPFTVRVTPIDSGGQTVSGLPGFASVRLSGSFSEDGGQISPGPVDVVVTPQGVGLQALTAVSFQNALHSAIVVQVNTGDPFRIETHLIDHSPLMAGQPLSSVGVSVFDQFNNPVPNATVQVTVNLYQNGNVIGTTTVTVTTGPDGTAVVPPQQLPDNTTNFTVSSTVPSAPGVSSSLSSPVAANVIFNIAFVHQTVEAGMSLSFTITAINPDTGAVATEYTGTVYVYPYQRRIHGTATAQGQDSTSGETLTITFTSDDRGVKFVQDGIVLTQRGEVMLAVSTEAPTVESSNTIDVRSEADFNTILATITIQNITDQSELIGGFSNEVVVIPTRPVGFIGLSLGTGPIQATVGVVDRFDNAVFLEPIQFEFDLNGTTTTFTGVTDGFGEASGFGPTNLDDAVENTITVTATFVRFPDLPAATATITLGTSDQLSRTTTSSDPTVVKLGENGQPVASVTYTMSGTTTQEFLTFSYRIQINDEPFGDTVPHITFSAGAVSAGQMTEQGAPTMNGPMIEGTVKNASAVQLNRDSEGRPVSTPYSFTWTVDGIQIDVPEAESVAGRHPDGRLTATCNSGSGGVRLLAFFGKTLTFVGSVVPSGNPALNDPTSGKSRAGVFIVDSEYVTRTLVTNPGLIGTGFSSHATGTFRLMAMDPDLGSTSSLKIKIQSFDAEGNPITDPLTQEALPDVLVPVTVQSESDQDTISNVVLSDAIVAVDAGFRAERAVGGKPGKLLLKAESAVPADGQTKARIEALVTYPDGTPVQGASVTLAQEGSLEGATVTLEQPSGTTDGAGKISGTVTSTGRGTVKISASVNAPSQGTEHPGFSANTQDSPVRILFLAHLYMVTTVPGGKISATLVTASSGGTGPASPAPGFSDQVKTAAVLGVDIQVKPEEESSFRPAACALVKGVAPQIEFKFIPTMEVFSIPDDFNRTPPSLFRQEFKIAVVVDDGSDETSLDRGRDAGKRIYDPSASSEFTKDAAGGTIHWTVSPGSTPFGAGGNRVRIVLAGGPAIAVARMLNYTETKQILICPYVGSGESDFAVVDGGTVAKDSYIVEFKDSTSDIKISERLRHHRLAPVGVMRMLGVVETLDFIGRDMPPVESQLNEDQDVAYALINPAASFAQQQASPAASESIPATFLGGGLFNGRPGGYVNVGGGETTSRGLDKVWPHIVMDTFAAHRLAVRVPPTQGNTPQVSMSIVDSGFGAGNPNRLLGVFNAERRLGRLLDASGHRPSDSVFLPPDQPTRTAWESTAIEDVNSAAMHDMMIPGGHAGHGTMCAETAFGSGGEDEVGILGTGRHVDRVNFVKIYAANGTTPGLTGFEELSSRVETTDLYRVMAPILEESLRGNPNQRPGLKPDVITVSMRTTPSHAAVVRARSFSEHILDIASQNGVIVVVGSGNEHADIASDVFPAATAPPRGSRRQSQDNDWQNHGTAATATASHSPLVVTVGATRLTAAADAVNVGEAFAVAFSNTGDRVSVVAPGSGIMARSHTDLNAQGGTAASMVSGTSFSTPYTAGILGEMVRLDRGLGQMPAPGAAHNARKLLLIRYLEATANYFGPANNGVQNNQLGYGRVNAWKALLAVANDGLSETRPDFLAATIPIRNDAQTRWYGFSVEARTRTSVLFEQLGAAAPVPIDDQTNMEYPALVSGSRLGSLYTYRGQPFTSVIPRGVTVSPLLGVDAATDGFYSARFSIPRAAIVNPGAPPVFTLNAQQPHATFPYYSVTMDLPTLRDNAQNGLNVDYDKFVFRIAIPTIDGELTRAGVSSLSVEGDLNVARLPADGTPATLTLTLRQLNAARTPLAGVPVTIVNAPNVAIANAGVATDAAGKVTMTVSKTAANENQGDGIVTFTFTNVGTGAAGLSETMRMVMRLSD